MRVPHCCTTTPAQEHFQHPLIGKFSNIKQFHREKLVLVLGRVKTGSHPQQLLEKCLLRHDGLGTGIVDVWWRSSLNFPVMT
jgi:hypothetical protein